MLGPTAPATYWQNWHILIYTDTIWNILTHSATYWSYHIPTHTETCWDLLLLPHTDKTDTYWYILTQSETYWHIVRPTDPATYQHILKHVGTYCSCHILTKLTHTDIYWHNLKHTDIYWHIPTQIDTYCNLLIMPHTDTYQHKLTHTLQPIDPVTYWQNWHILTLNATYWSCHILTHTNTNWHIHCNLLILSHTDTTDIYCHILTYTNTYCNLLILPHTDTDITKSLRLNLSEIEQNHLLIHRFKLDHCLHFTIYNHDMIHTGSSYSNWSKVGTGYKTLLEQRKTKNWNKQSNKYVVHKVLLFFFWHKILFKLTPEQKDNY